MKVNVKWNKELYKDIEVDMNEAPEVFKIQLHSLTGVPVHLQKVMGKGGLLADDEWGRVSLKEGMTVVMLGTAEKPPDVSEAAPAPQFIEDLPEEARLGTKPAAIATRARSGRIAEADGCLCARSARACCPHGATSQYPRSRAQVDGCARLQEQHAVETKQYGSGLVNLGNTCYANACLQCLYVIPELTSVLGQAAERALGDGFTQASGRLFKEMARGGTVTPAMFIMSLRSTFPQFDQMGTAKTAEGARVHAQQDAEECWGAVRRCLRVSWTRFALRRTALADHHVQPAGRASGQQIDSARRLCHS
jgi:Ubiquitin carboxyl-terminal hydrolase